MHLAQFDVSTAFLYGELEKIIYIEQPKGYEDKTKRMCRLQKSLYGLKQAPRCSNKNCKDFLLKLGFRPCLYILTKEGRIVIVILYVDDGLVVTIDLQDLESFFQQLKAEFKVTTTAADYFLGFQIERNEDGDKKQDRHS